MAKNISAESSGAFSKRSVMAKTSSLPAGGGVPSYADNMELMNSRGLTVYLNTSRDLLLRRLNAGRRSRPLLSGLDDSSLETFVDRLFAEREPYYSEAKATFSGDLLESLEQIELSANRFIESFHIN